jgi:hypothetical protein
MFLRQQSSMLLGGPLHTVKNPLKLSGQMLPKKYNIID